MSAARARVHAMFPLDEPTAEAELDLRLDAYRTEVLAADGQAWPGELDHLRALAAALATAADAGDLTAIRKLLAAHARINTRHRTEQYAANGGGR